MDNSEEKNYEDEVLSADAHEKSQEGEKIDYFEPRKSISGKGEVRIERKEKGFW